MANWVSFGSWSVLRVAWCGASSDFVRVWSFWADTVATDLAARGYVCLQTRVDFGLTASLVLGYVCLQTRVGYGLSARPALTYVCLQTRVDFGLTTSLVSGYPCLHSGLTWG